MYKNAGWFVLLFVSSIFWFSVRRYLHTRHVSISTVCVHSRVLYCQIAPVTRRFCLFSLANWPVLKFMRAVVHVSFATYNLGSVAGEWWSKALTRYSFSDLRRSYIVTCWICHFVSVSTNDVFLVFRFLFEQECVTITLLFNWTCFCRILKPLNVN